MSPIQPCWSNHQQKETRIEGTVASSPYTWTMTRVTRLSSLLSFAIHCCLGEFHYFAEPSTVRRRGNFGLRVGGEKENMARDGGTSELPTPMLRSADHQVAGHRFDEGRVGSLVDESGRFYKPLQDGVRGNREIEFYETLQKDEGVPSHIRSFFPKFFGTIFIEAPGHGPIKRHGIMEDLAHGFHNTSIIDLKIGFRTWYPEATEHYIEKNKLKDTRTTSGALGFRVSGMQAYDVSSGAIFKGDRDWARKLTVDEVTVALKRFVSSNPREEKNPDAAFASAIYGGPHGVIAQLEVLKDWFSTQTTYHFASSSILIFVDGDSLQSMTKENVNTSQFNASKSVAVKLVDFAHTLSSGKSSLDENFLEGLNSVIRILSSILESISST